MALFPIPISSSRRKAATTIGADSHRTRYDVRPEGSAERLSSFRRRRFRRLRGMTARGLRCPEVPTSPVLTLRKRRETTMFFCWAQGDFRSTFSASFPVHSSLGFLSQQSAAHTQSARSRTAPNATPTTSERVVLPFNILSPSGPGEPRPGTSLEWYLHGGLNSPLTSMIFLSLRVLPNCSPLRAAELDRAD